LIVASPEAIPERGTILEPLALTCCSGQPATVDPAGSVLVFYRGFWCEHCRDQFVELRELAPAFRQAGFRIVAISSDSQVLAEAMCSLVSGRVSIFRDPKAALITAYGLADRDEAVERVIARPAVFIIGIDRTIEYRYLSRSAEDRPASALLLLGAESLAK
jgi:peroxiredoxin